MNMAALPTDIESASRILHAREVSAVELTEAYLKRIECTESNINAFITVTPEEALGAARAADDVAARGVFLGPLHGIPVGIKDNINTAGIRTTCGAAFLEGNVPGSDATVVKRLKRAGAIIIGKTNMHEFAWGRTTENEHFGATRNPWDPNRNAHGSSGGSAAAVAAGQCLLAIGTDTGGSVRNPAAVTGLTGMRPTVGRISNAGVFPLAWSMDTVGPISRTVKDAAIAYTVIAGHDPADPATTRRLVPLTPPGCDLRGKRIGIIRDFALGNVDNGVRAAMEHALSDLEDAGVSIVDVNMPDIAEYYDAWLIVHTAEPSAVHRQLLTAHRDEYGVDVRGMLHAGQSIPAGDYILAQRYRQHLRQRFLSIFADLDAMVMPTCATIATRVGEDPREIARRRVTPDDGPTFYAGLASTLAMPALSVQCGMSDGMPVGMQIMGKPYDEETILAIGMAYQEITHWHQAVAPV